MKKQLRFPVISDSRFIPLFAFLPYILLAAPIGPPAAPSILEQGFVISDHEWTHLRLGYSQDFLLHQSLVGKNAQHPGIQGSSSIATLVWNIKERLDIQGFSGSGQFSWDYIQDDSFICGQTNPAWIWGGSAKGIVLEVKDTTFSCSISGGYWQEMKGHYSFNEIPMKKDAHIKLRFWQIAAGITQKISRFYPYLGCAIQHTLIQMEVKPVSLKLHEQHQLGPFLGCTLTNGIEYMLNLEWRGWFEQGITGSCEIRF